MGLFFWENGPFYYPLCWQNAYIRSVTKEQVKAACVLFLENKVEILQSTLKSLEDDMMNESKSSVGDKHETSRAMLHNEQEKTQKQLHELLLQKSALEQISFNESHEKVVLGSLIQTNRNLIYLAVGLGRLMIDGREVFVLSGQSPLGAKLIGLKKNETAMVNGTKYQIVDIS